MPFVRTALRELILFRQEDGGRRPVCLGDHPDFRAVAEVIRREHAASVLHGTVVLPPVSRASGDLAYRQPSTRASKSLSVRRRTRERVGQASSPRPGIITSTWSRIQQHTTRFGSQSSSSTPSMLDNTTIWRHTRNKFLLAALVQRVGRLRGSAIPCSAGSFSAGSASWQEVALI